MPFAYVYNICCFSIVTMLTKSFIGFLIINLQICDLRGHQFPEDFEFGVATSAYQIEGAWNVNGKGENIWDRFTHEYPHRILDRSNGDMACDSYRKVKEDVALLKKLGVHFYRFSLSWSRILPTGYVDKINPDGLNYYNDLINELIKNNIKPVVTLYHWDLPQALHEAGGWTSPFIADYFEDFAWVAFKHFGDRVKTWITINEPYHVCQSGYATGFSAPGYNSSGIGNFHCSHTILLAHAKAYHLYDKEFRSEQNGVIGITIDTFWYEPKTNSSEDIYIAEAVLQTNFDWFAHPIFSKAGGYPPIMVDIIANKSKTQSLRRSRLPTFTEEERKFIVGTSDFFGLNHYSTFLVSPGEDNSRNFLAHADLNVVMEQDPSWEKTPTFWITIVPWGFRKLLNRIKSDYNNPPIYITENGMGDNGELNDEQRVRYFKEYLKAVSQSIHEDGCNIKSYTAWSLMDNFEWSSGYTLKFGIHSVDFSDTNLKRMPKASAVYYEKVINTKNIDHDYEPVSFKTSGAAARHLSILTLIISLNFVQKDR